MYRWMSGEKKFCFVTLRTEAEAEKGPHSAPFKLDTRVLPFDRGDAVRRLAAERYPADGKAAADR
eukprot:COSAG04_NODE_1471_length_6586_cov_1.959149_4_plen_65_part_00